ATRLGARRAEIEPIARELRQPQRRDERDPELRLDRADRNLTSVAATVNRVRGNLPGEDRFEDAFLANGNVRSSPSQERQRRGRERLLEAHPVPRPVPDEEGAEDRRRGQEPRRHVDDLDSRYSASRQAERGEEPGKRRDVEVVRDALRVLFAEARERAE